MTSSENIRKLIDTISLFESDETVSSHRDNAIKELEGMLRSMKEEPEIWWYHADPPYEYNDPDIEYEEEYEIISDIVNKLKKGDDITKADVEKWWRSFYQASAGGELYGDSDNSERLEQLLLPLVVD